VTAALAGAFFRSFTVLNLAASAVAYACRRQQWPQAVDLPYF
jgi:hypothetical protein